MGNVTIELVLELAEQLTLQERARLVERLQATLHLNPIEPVTREQLLAEFERRRAVGAFQNRESLRGKYANPNIHVSNEELNAYLHEIGAEWEAEMDELVDKD